MEAPYLYFFTLKNLQCIKTNLSNLQISILYTCNNSMYKKCCTNAKKQKKLNYIYGCHVKIYITLYYYKLLNHIILYTGNCACFFHIHTHNFNWKPDVNYFSNVAMDLQHTNIQLIYHKKSVLTTIRRLQIHVCPTK